MQQFLKEIVKEAGAIAKEYFCKKIRVTSKTLKHDLLTEADETVSEFLVRRIHETYPEHQIKSEEMEIDINNGAEYEWVIDPIDGTWVFAKGIPTWAVMIAVVRNGEPHLGAVYFPVANELFFAEVGKGAFLNGKQLHVNNTDTLDASVGAFHKQVQGNHYGVHFERFQQCALKIAEYDIVRLNFGSSASFSFVASGALDFAVSNGGMDWDRLPIYLINAEAGAMVTDSDGNPWKRGRQDIVIANPQLHPKVMELFR